MQIVQIPINDIKPYWRNPRDNTNAIEAVKQSIQTYGFNTPLIIDKENVIIAGHTRYKALMELGYKEIACVVLDVDPNKAKEYRIADNKTSELATWDLDKLIPELREIHAIEEFKIYFPELDLSDLLQDSAGAINFQDHTQEQIDKVQNELDNKFEDRGNKTDYIEVLCSHCGEPSFLARTDIMKQPTVAYN